MTSYNIRTQPLEIMKEELKNSDNDNFLILIWIIFLYNLLY